MASWCDDDVREWHPLEALRLRLERPPVPPPADDVERPDVGEDADV